MTNTPEPKANTLDEILAPWVGFVHSEYDGTSMVDDELAVIATAKQQIQALITEARNKALDDVKFYGHGYDDGTGFSIKISYEQLNALKLTPKENN